jgi:glycosyltransferase involved in cell wall biosynthesis
VYKHDICFVGLENLPVLAPEYNRLGSGGEQVQQTLLSRALSERGYRVTMVVLDHGQPDGAVFGGVTTYRAYPPRAGVFGLRFVHPRWTGMWSAMKRADARVYYVSCAGMRLGLVAMFCRRHGRRSVFRIAHDNDCRPLESSVHYPRDRKLYEYGVARVDRILAQSLRQQNDMRTYYRRDSTVAGMLVEAPPRVLPFGERDLDILWVNNLAAFKRPDLAVELARRLPGRRFVIIGGTQAGAEKLERAVREAAAELPNLEFLGPVPYHEINAWYARAKLFVNTSDSEGFPNSYLQSWVRGTPLVAFFDPDGLVAREGLGVVPRDIGDMATAVERLLGDHGAWQAISERAVSFMERGYSAAAILPPYLEAIGPAESPMASPGVA